ncbi:hypothetical protein SERLA73DRAFT_85379 [Serpula lacrymans var. lacrymans S7.3]|uniref:Cns1/TTC4 wheel domain-containing protein n=2 Tax=Serpula lacrymans var. lacrymans TaxID=341189 RepID=F8PQP8_SERL3|nr:uncharacterized protein SERLADRAFT_360092 [Serpula lacrymans var. lacrymans S7.9]EGO01608.1 hypothetical protein SERLA73DRAFT_85379 [Serpula lacrymans var. lacrymans S7.3]EGO27264.1 hypothetical protein SERLADRAFT_360092 [Serpula lacrymans var. lacrymans S7.9]
MSSQNPAPLPQPVSVDDKLAAFDSIPLFMKSLPTEDTTDVALEALQSLVHEGTPDEVAQNFKEQGNEYFKGKRYREALGFYTQGVDAEPTDPVLREALLCNRAACNLELKNYGSVLRDCSQVLKINAHSSKAYFRSSSALLALERVEEALDCCDHCLQFDRDNQGIKGVRERTVKMKEQKERKERERLERIQKEEEEKRRLKAAFDDRNLVSIINPQGPSDNPYKPHFEPLNNSELIFPVFFLYPQYATSDVISHFAENTHFSAHLILMFPPGAPAPEWDKKGEYVVSDLVVYAMTHRKRLLKIGKRMTLRDVCNATKEKDGDAKDGLEIKDGCLTFVVLVKGDVEKNWVDEFKKTRDG